MSHPLHLRALRGDYVTAILARSTRHEEAESWAIGPTVSGPVLVGWVGCRRCINLLVRGAFFRILSLVSQGWVVHESENQQGEVA